MPHPQHPQSPATFLHSSFPVRMATTLGLLLLLALMASLWQNGAQAAMFVPAGIGASATDTAPPGDENYLQEENPAKLRRVAKLRVAPATAAELADPLVASRRPASAADSLIPATITDIARSPPGRRQQRGQAPPQA